MDGFGGDGLFPFFSQPEPYSPVHSDVPFRRSSTSATAARQSLDLNSDWPNLAEYQGMLQSGRGGGSGGDGSGGGRSGGGGSGGRPPLPGRRGGGGGQRTLGLRATRGGGTVSMPGGFGGTNTPPRGRPVGGVGRTASQADAARAGGHRRRHDDGLTDDEDVEEIRPSQGSKTDVAKWTDRNNTLLCQFLVEQMEKGNYNNGTLNSRGYKAVLERYRAATNLRHDRKQISNRIRQLKQMYNFIKELHSATGLGRDEQGWPTADKAWWDERTQGHSEWKKLKCGPPEYLDLLEQIFDGVAVDGSSAYVPGQQSMDIEDEDADAADIFEIHEDSPQSNGSHKRTSSTSTTATSPVKKCKSPVVKMMNKWFTTNSKQADQQISLFQQMASIKVATKQTALQLQHQREEAALEREKAERKLVQRLAREAGIDETSVEYYAVSYICQKQDLRDFFINMETTEGRVAFLKRFTKDHNLN